MLAAPCRTRSHQPAKSGSSVDMKSAKAERCSSFAAGSSTSGMSRVNGSSSTTMTGKRDTAGGSQFFFGSTSTRSAVNTRLCIR